MVTPDRQGAPSNATQFGRLGRSDLAMSILQYGTAIIAIVAVTLLGLAR